MLSLGTLDYDPTNPAHVQERSWIGDAVLALLAREWILLKGELPFAERSELYRNLTSNQFLNSLGAPAKVEADLGTAYIQGGIEAARSHFEEHFVPLFLKQERNRRRRSGSFQ